MRSLPNRLTVMLLTTKTRRLFFGARVKNRAKLRLAAKIIGEYEHAQEYKPRKKSVKRKLGERSIGDDLQVESVPEEEVTKIVVEGTHDYPSAPGTHALVSLFCRCACFEWSNTFRAK